MADLKSVWSVPASSFLRSVLVFDDQLLVELSGGSGDPLKGLETFAKVFAAAGLVAMPGVPTWVAADEVEDEQIKNILDVACKSDIVVLDWNLEDHDGGVVGSIATRISCGLLEAADGELRLVAIYSSWNYAEIVEALERKFGEASECCNGAHWKKEQFHLKVIRKEGERDPDLDELVEQVSIESLPARLVDFFEHATEGVVPRTVVRAIGKARGRAGHVLGRFTSDADMGFLGEAIAKGSVSAALRQLIDAVKDDAFGDLASELEKQTTDDLQSTLSALIQGLCEADLIECESDVDIREKATEILSGRLKIKRMEKNNANPSHLLEGDMVARTPHASDLSFSALTQTRSSSVTDGGPILQLGTVVEWSGTDLGICLLPLCDAERSGPGRFPFAILSEAEMPTATGFPISFGSGKEHRSRDGLYNASMRLRDVVFVEFTTGVDEPVRAELVEELWTFQNGIEEGDKPVGERTRSYGFVCELRAPVAFKLAQQILNNAGRFGLDLPEWIRRPVNVL